VPIIRFQLRRTTPIAIVILGLSPGVTARADEPVTIDVTLKDHRFSPSEIHVPTGKPAVLKIRNEDSTAEEFDSSALKVEKIVPAGASASVRLRPLGPGRFPFMGEFHPDTAQGVVISE
jgi:hypothetical protein